MRLRRRRKAIRGPIEFDRSPVVEHGIVSRAARAHGASCRDATELSAFANERALPGPVRRADGQSFPREAREEIADARNYLVWHYQILERSGATPRELNDVDRAIAALVRAWGWLCRVETP